jgi:integrase/recombinase XerC
MNIRRFGMIDLNQLPYRSWLLSLSPTNQGHIAAYLTLQQARMRAPSTIERILTALKCFYTRLPDANRARLAHDLSLATSQDIDAWLDAASRQGLAVATRAGRLGLMRHFFDFLKQQGHMRRQPVLPRQHHIQVPHRLPRPMTDEDVIAFFHVIDKLRDRLFFLVMLRCGLRSGEARTLPWTAINWDQQTLRIDNSKGAVDRIVYFSPDVEINLQQWQQAKKQESPYVFPSPMRTHKGKPLSKVRAHTLFAHYIAKAALNPAYTSHCLRHTFATNLLNAGASLEVVKELMGHTSLDMTLRYAKLYDATKRQQYDNAMAHMELRYARNRR